MENKVLLQNLEQIKRYDTELFNKILTIDIEKSNISLAQNENREYNLVLDSSFIVHNAQGALEEAKRIIADIEDEKNSIKIIYGLGLGYLADEASNKIQSGTIIIYEPNIELLKFVFSIAKIDAIYKKNVILCSTKNKLQEHVVNIADKKTALSISFLDSYKIYYNDIKDILAAAQIAKAQKTGNDNTLLKRASWACATTLYNLRNIVNNPDISQIKNIYKGKTALICAAGPSLEENIETIKKNRDKFIIFALNPTLKLLSNNQIDPDFIVAVDSTNIISQFDSIDSSKYYFILESFVNSQVSALKTKKTFNYISRDNFFNPWVLDTLKIKEHLKSAGTVSYIAFMSAYYMGFERIIFVGLDLAYKNNLCYSKDSQWSEMKCVWNEDEKKYKIVSSNKQKLIEAFMKINGSKEEAAKLCEKRLNYLNENLCTVRGCDGSYIPSKTDYAVFIKCFEDIADEILKINPEIKLINSSKGAQIDGFENMALEDIVLNLEKVEKKDLQEYCSSADMDFVKSRTDKLLSMLEKYQSLVLEFILINEKIIKELTNKKIFTDSIIKQIKKHKEILGQIVKLKDDEDIGFIVYLYLNLYKKYFEINYLENEKTALETITKMNEDYKTIQSETAFKISTLSDSKALISKQFFNV